MSLFKLFLTLILISIQIFAADIFVNQVGYLPNLPKYFYSSEYSDSFYVVEESSGTIYYRGKLILSVTNDPATGLTIYLG